MRGSGILSKGRERERERDHSFPTMWRQPSANHRSSLEIESADITTSLIVTVRNKFLLFNPPLYAAVYNSLSRLNHTYDRKRLRRLFQLGHLGRTISRNDI